MHMLSAYCQCFVGVSLFSILSVLAMLLTIVGTCRSARLPQELVMARTRRPRRPVNVLVVVAVLAALVATGPAPAAAGPPRPAPAAAPATPAAPRLGELPERRTRTSTTRRNPNGTLTMTVSAGPVHYQAADGSWQRIDPSLRPINQQGYRWQNTAGPFTARFRPTLTQPGFLTLGVGGRQLTLSAAGAAGQAAQATGNQIRYAGAWPSADLTYNVTPDGVKETIRLRDAHAPVSYQFHLSLPAGASATRRPDGSYTLAWPGGPRLLLAAPTVTQAAEPGRLAPPDPAAKPSLTLAQQGRDLVARVGLDRGWLAAPDRRFPVELDPTITMVVQPDVEDANFPTLANYLPFVDQRLFMGGDANYIWRAALRFDLSAVPATTITDARLGLYWDGWCMTAQTSFCGGVDHVLEAHRATTAWSTASTSSQLTFDPAVAGSYTWQFSVSGNRWMTWPLTGLVGSWLDGSQPNYGLVIARNPQMLNTSGPVPPGWRFTGDPTLRPKLEITYVSDAVDLLTPDTVHANGAELAWTRYTGPSGASFDRYQVHRSTQAGFTPQPATLLTTIRDPDTTTWRDSTAAASTSTTTKTFYYKVVANTSASNQLTVTMPLADTSRKVLQPGPAAGQVTYLRNDIAAATGDECLDYGAAAYLRVGAATSGALHRPLLRFDLRDIPPSATISAASLRLYHNASSATPGKINLHRVTRAWREGGGVNACTRTGAIWQEAQPDLPWTAPTQGGDYDSAILTSVTDSTVPSGWDNYPVTSLVGQWVAGTAPNHGVLLKLDSEAIPTSGARWFDYRADDETLDPTHRPQLTVDYNDASAVVAPTVALAAPAPGAKVSGTSVRLTAAASDDRRVDKVDFYVDGVLKATATATPWEATWDSTSVATGTTHSITARATDDAGNQTTTTPATSVTVDNTNPPTTAVTAAAPSAADPSKWTVSASASDDKGVARVEFYADQARFAEATTAPYQATWDTLDPLTSAYDGAHTLTTKAYDSSGQVTTSAGFAVMVANSTGSEYQASFELNGTGSDDDAMPSLMIANPTAAAQEPYASTTPTRTLTSAPHDSTSGATGCPAGSYCPTVTVTNNSSVTWKNNSGTDLRVWYRWYAPNGVVLYEGPASDNFPQTVQPGAVSKPLQLVINPPALPPGAQLGQYRLRLDLYDVGTGRWFAQGGNQPTVDNPILVARTLKDALGLERYWQYEGEPVGAGMSTLTNVANGNMLLRWTPLADPGRGLSTVLDLTYNALEDHSESPAGNNFSLAISGLTRFGMGLDIHPNKADQISGNADKWVALVDGDGTPHRFTGTTQKDGSTRWAEPAGVNLYLRSIATNPAERRWALTRPDKVTFFFDEQGFPTAVTDRNNNTLSFKLDPIDPADDPGGPKQHVTAVTDAGGRAFTVVYYTKADTNKPQVRGKVKRITDHSGHALDFDYYDDGNLLRLTQRGGTNADGTILADRSFVFTYTDNTGEQPAITNIADRVSPDPKTPNQSTRLYSVRDPRQVAAGPAGVETTFTYYGPSAGPTLRWRLKDRTNRPNNKTSFAYDPVAQTTTVTAPPAATPRVTTYTYDTDGKVSQITNPLHQTTGVQWSADFKVTQVTEPPPGVFTTYDYNANGYLTDRTDAEGNHTQLTYRNDPVDAADTAGHLSLLTSRTNPKGMATPGVPDDYQWTFGYDPAGNLASVTDPEHNATTNAWNPDGTLASTTDANRHTTTYNSYDPSGLPTRITDAKGQVTQASYDPDGLLVWLQDPLHAGDTGNDTRSYRRYFDYDSFRRLGRQSAPKSTRFDRGQLIWTSGAYDPNDNLVKQVGAHYGASDPGTGPTSTFTYDAMDQQTLASNPQTEQTRVDYDDAGRVIKVTSPKGVATSGPLNLDKDFATLYEYDDLDRVIRQKQHTVDATGAITATRTTHYCYDLAGDLRSVTQPNANLATVTCPGTGPATGVGFTSTYDYDTAHRPLATTDPLGHRQARHYDANDNVDSTTDANNNTTTLAYDQRDLPVQVTEPLDAATSRNVVTRFAYDAVGNRTKLISPRAFDAGGPSGPWTQYVTDYAYDEVNQLVRVDLPKSAAETERHSIHRAYDPNGNLLWTSLPVATQTAADIATSSTARTVMSYFDPGWIRTAKDPANPRVAFDYTAHGWQASRTPDVKGSPGTPDTSRTSRWEYYPDGLLKTLTGRDGKPNGYTYDANNNLLIATEGRGVDDPGQARRQVEASYTGFDQLAKVRHKKATEANWTFTRYKAYDLDGNLTERLDDGQEDNAGTVLPTPVARRNTFAYDQADWLTTQFDWGTDATSCSGDQQLSTSFTPVGLEASRTLAKGTSACTEAAPAWSTKQTTTWDWFANAKLKTLVTKNGAGTVQESHTVGYTDPTGIYVNGNRTTDTYTLNGPGATACASTPCTQTWTYDPRDRLIRHDDGHGGTSSYTLDEPARQSDPLIRAGNATTQTDPRNGTRNLRYTGDQLSEISTASGVTGKYWYDDDANLDCVTTAAGTKDDCSPSGQTTPSANLISDYGYDALNRLVTARGWTYPSNNARYTYDPLDRLVSEWENHYGFARTRTTTFDYLGLTNLATRETRKDSAGALLRDNTYGYDVYGHRLTLASTTPSGTGTTTSRYTYGYDVHGSVSLLLDETTGNAAASYGYTPYGDRDDTLTKGDTDTRSPINPYRYTAKRYDTGAKTLDMGARRFGPDVGRFLQQDQLESALGDLGLAADPLTGNRYALAGGNPVSYVEWDGHMIIDGGGTASSGGGSATSSAPPPAPTSSPSAGAYAATREAGAGWSNPTSTGSETACEKLGACAQRPETTGKTSSKQLDLTNTELVAQYDRIAHWGGSTQAHRAVQKELLRRLCPSSALGPLQGKCKMDLVLSSGEKADIALFKTGAVYEVKPHFPWKITEAKRQIAGYLELLNQSLQSGDPKYQTGIFSKGPKPQWHKGEEFDEFSMDFRGHRLLVKWVEPGIVTYRPDCDPDCDAELNISRPTIWHIFKSVLSIPLPGVTLDPVPVAP
jgi:RHS repeat-associated protein